MNRKIQDAFNDQINAELYSSYLYLSMSAWFESQSLRGMAQWMKMQAQEEMAHVEKIYGFILNRGGRVILASIDGPKIEWETPMDVLQDTYKHECHVSSLIHTLVDLALAEKDHAAHNFLQWFVSEQVEEEASVQEVLDRMKLAEENKAMLFMIDQKMGERALPSSADA